MTDLSKEEWLEVGSYDHPLNLSNSAAHGFPAKRSSVGNKRHLRAYYYWEDRLLTATSIPKGSIVLSGNISPETGRQQGVTFHIDSTDYEALIDLMIKSSPKRTMSAIAKALAAHAARLPEENWLP